MEGITVVSALMREHPVGRRLAMRDLSLGPVPWGCWSWTFSDGTTYASVTLSKGRPCGWGMVTHEVDYLPVVGVYVAQERRGEGLARLLVSSVLGYGLGQGYLVGGQEIFCSDHRWARYPEILEGCGLRARAWE